MTTTYLIEVLDGNRETVTCEYTGTFPNAVREAEEMGVYYDAWSVKLFADTDDEPVWEG